MDQMFLPENEDLLDQTVLCEKDRHRRDGGWREESKEDLKMLQNQRHQNSTQHSVVQNLCEKRNDADWKNQNTEAASKSSPKKGKPDVKAKSKGTPFASQKKMKKNTPKKSSRGLKLNFNQVKILNQPTMRISLIVLVKIHMFIVMKNHPILM